MGLPILFRGSPSPPTLTGAGASTFRASVGASGREVFAGSGGSAFGFASVADGREAFRGVASSTFGGAIAVAGAQRFAGDAASSFTWMAEVAGDQRFVGGAASAFGFSPSGFGAAIGPLPPPPPLAGMRITPQRLRPRPISAQVAIAFGMRVEARAAVLEPLVLRGASRFAAGLGGTGALDLAPLRIALEDEAFLLGIDDRELAPAR